VDFIDGYASIFSEKSVDMRIFVSPDPRYFALLASFRINASVTTLIVIFRNKNFPWNFNRLR